jgi:asparagine synthase (glutamine-hydrolysing)
MCGISGALRLGPEAPALDRDELLRTRDSMASRGPDGAGLWLSEDGRVALGHRRLAIIDLSEAALQPMPWGALRVVFNGEIYNYKELRAELLAEGTALRTASDTEVILALYARHGEQAFSRLRGMYALALWDEPRGRLLLARDPLGIKPLYYTIERGVLRFASQVRALEASGAISLSTDPGAVAGFLLWGAVPEPLTLRAAVRGLPAGHLLSIEGGVAGEPRPLPPAEVPPLEAEPIEDSVRAHLVSDVPVGVFLSAGLDSSLVAALARRHVEAPLLSLTLRFESHAGLPQDEGPLAAEVARVLGTRHQEQVLTHAELEQHWQATLRVMDQPSNDGFNSYLVSLAAHQAGLKVVLSGLGGDELFGSYPSFRDVPRWAWLAGLAGRVPGLRAAWPSLASLVPSRPKLRGLLREDGLPAAYLSRRLLFLPEELPALLGPERAEAGLRGHDPLVSVAALASGAPDAWTAVRQMESGCYLRNQLLRDSDWASMAHGLELRVPLVDAWLEARLAARGFEPARSQGKATLVRRLAPELPDSLFGRAKTGFRIPFPDPRRLEGGMNSRQLALDVLDHFGVPVRRP